MIVHLGWTGSAPPQRVIDAVEAVRRASSCDVLFHDDDSAIPAAWLDAMDRRKLSPHMRSDIQRHAILKKHGGLWLDADVRVLADPTVWAAGFDRYTAVRMADRIPMIGTDIIYVPPGWVGWPAVDAYIERFLFDPPAQFTVLHVAGQMISVLSKASPGDFAVLDPGTKFPMTRTKLSAASVVARGFNPAAATALPRQQPPKPQRLGLGGMVKAGLSAVGITEERVSKAIGKPCGCSKRAKKLDEFGHKYLGLPPGASTENRIDGNAGDKAT